MSRHCSYKYSCEFLALGKDANPLYFNTSGMKETSRKISLDGPVIAWEESTSGDSDTSVRSLLCVAFCASRFSAAFSWLLCLASARPRVSTVSRGSLCDSEHPTLMKIARSGNLGRPEHGRPYEIPGPSTGF